MCYILTSEMYSCLTSEVVIMTSRQMAIQLASYPQLFIDYLIFPSNILDNVFIIYCMYYMYFTYILYFLHLNAF